MGERRDGVVPQCEGRVGHGLVGIGSCGQPPSLATVVCERETWEPCLCRPTDEGRRTFR